MGNSSSKKSEANNATNIEPTVIVPNIPNPRSHSTTLVPLHATSPSISQPTTVRYNSTTASRSAGTSVSHNASLHGTSPTPISPAVVKTNVPTYAPHASSSPGPPVIGNQSVKHSVNNYVIPKEQKNSDVQGNPITVPYRKLADKYLLRVCPQYNSRVGCSVVVCRRLHVCYDWVQEKCHRTSCDYDHDFNAHFNQNIISAFSSRRDVNCSMVNEILKNNHRCNRRTKRKEPDTICMYSILRKCNKSPCNLVHANKSYVWEMKHNDVWLPLAHDQSNALEGLYSQPDQDVVDLPPAPNLRKLTKLNSILMQNTKWQVDFEAMKIFSCNTNYELRRLSTPSDICIMNRLSTRWVWYWEDDIGVWKPYLDGCGSKFYIIALSDQLEHHYNYSDNSGIDVSIGTFSYNIDVSSMTQLNKGTGRQRKVRRRPYNTVDTKEKDITFCQFFSPTSSDSNIRHIVPKSTEFAFVRGLVLASIQRANVLKVERVVNNYLWKAYQNKKGLLKTLYQNDSSLINEQYLFHGTKHSVIDKICEDNFDWKLFGSNVGNVYGRGVYFSNLASLSDSYSETDPSGTKVMFIALVLVGSLCIGNSSMQFPPQNQSTGRCFDTTCDDQHSSRVFVKYNRDEYYPAYIVHYGVNHDFR